MNNSLERTVKQLEQEEIELVEECGIIPINDEVKISRWCVEPLDFFDNDEIPE